MSEDYWKDYTYKPNTFGEHFGGTYQHGKDYVQYPGIKPGETVKMYGEDKDKIFNGYTTWSKPDEVRYEEIKLPIKPIDEVVLPEPEMVTIKTYNKGDGKKLSNDYWEEVQVPANSSQVTEWQKQLATGVKNNPNSPLLKFTKEAVNPVLKKQGGALLTKKVTCKNCGWKWDAADGGNDVTTCHKCGGQGLIHAQKGGMTMGQEVDLTPAQEAYLRKLGYKLERI